ncbi:uncharacterized protein LOC6533945 [Drosophila yakuba]|uniref:F-box domain-containing protein n=1 Tax=Drosophila yakuba TaxID=7245 RepID=B4PGW8_DROYA|nr:uncharacterized protein LOC6533945 [Drosophila yakuba]EDW94357.2 uncharacterized protein Dyak_GE20089 [Drosophila yakuba]
MGLANIEELYDDCLYHIFAFLPTEDRIIFAQVCHRFRQLFISQCAAKYRVYTLDKDSSRLELIQFCICREAVESLTIDLDHFDTARCYRTYGCVTPENCFQILCQTLAGMIRLEHLVVKQESMLVTPIEKPFDQILTAVRHSPKLRRLEVCARDDCSLDRLSQHCHLEHLQILVPKISLSTLVKCCKSSGNLRSLHLGYACIQKNLSYIVPHCKNLEVLRFGMPANSSEYLQLAGLPKLRELSYFGIRRSGFFEPLLSALAAKSQLTHLSIDGGSLTLQETCQLVRIQSLRHFKGFCSTSDCVEMLGCLANLEELCLSMFCPTDVSNNLLPIIAKCKDLKLRIAGGNVNAKSLKDAISLRKSEPVVLVVEK